MRALALALLAAGCAYRVHVTSEPPGALLTLPEGPRVSVPRELPEDRTVRLPTTLRISGGLFREHWAVVEAPGLRPRRVLLNRYRRRSRDNLSPLLHPRRLDELPARVTLTVILLPESLEEAVETPR